MLVLLGASNLRRMHEAFGSYGVPVTSLSVGGATVSPIKQNNLFNKLTEYLERRSCNDGDDIIILGGTNDFLSNVAISEIKKNYRKLVELAADNFNRVILAKVPPIPSLTREDNRVIAEFNEWLKAIGSLNPQCILVAETWDPFVEKGKEYPNMSLYESYYENGGYDMIHLNKDGLLLLRDVLLKAKVE